MTATVIVALVALASLGNATTYQAHLCCQGLLQKCQQLRRWEYLPWPPWAMQQHIRLIYIAKVCQKNACNCDSGIT